VGTVGAFTSNAGSSVMEVSQLRQCAPNLGDGRAVIAVSESVHA
jgi:hypothetical protein